VATDISPTTGEEYYSSSWENIKDFARTLRIGEGKIAKITQILVNKYQEVVDREIDGILNELYYVPIRHFNQMQPDGTKKRIFPGEIRQLAITWTTGLLLTSEFQGLDPNTNEQATSFVEDSRRKTFRIIRFNMRVQGQVQKSNMGRTMIPTMQPPMYPEPDF